MRAAVLEVLVNAVRSQYPLVANPVASRVNLPAGKAFLLRVSTVVGVSSELA